jgi:hypothetical protein
MNWRQRLGALIGGFDAGQHHRRLRGFVPNAHSWSCQSHPILNASKVRDMGLGWSTS